jgi:hypothetical protein
LVASHRKAMSCVSRQPAAEVFSRNTKHLRLRRV